MSVARRREGCGEVWIPREGGAGLKPQRPCELWAGASQHRRNRNEGTRLPGALSLQPPRPPRGGAVGRDPGDRAGTPGAGMRPENF